MISEYTYVTMSFLRTCLQVVLYSKKLTRMNTPAMLKAQTNSLKWNVHKNLLKYNLNVYATKLFRLTTGSNQC